MKESVLHYIWQFKLFSPQDLQTVDGLDVEVIDAGHPNVDAGPDFFNAKIKIDNTVWVGNVEIHVKSSNWYDHKHETDKAYNNVILHVTHQADRDVFAENGEKIAQMELPVPEYVLKNFDELFSAKKWIYCEDKIAEYPPFLMSSWKNALLVERLERKSNDILQLLETNNNHWEEAFYISLARNFGFSTNAQAFEQLAKSLPQTILAKHKDNLFQIESLLYGQAGFLEEPTIDDYYADLQKEYRFLQKKYQLTPIEKSQWKLLRLRPDNFPHIRIAQFAMLIHKSSRLFSKILNERDLKNIQNLFNSEVSEYWQTHYVFGSESRKSKKKLGKNSINIILINTVVPYLFNYLKREGEDTAYPLSILEQLPVENNAIILRWKELGVLAENAFDSQALLQLKKEYCDLKNCVRCRIGHKILSKK